MSARVCFHQLIDSASSERKVKECRSPTSLLNHTQINNSSNDKEVMNQIDSSCTGTIEMSPYRVRR